MQSIWWSALRESESSTDFIRRIESQNVNPLVKNDFVALAFEACRLGKVEILKWLIQFKNIPIQTVWGNEVQTPTSLLHLAVLANDLNLIEWLTNKELQQWKDLVDLFCLEIDGETALDTALRLYDHGGRIIAILLDIQFGVLWVRYDGLVRALAKAQNAADAYLASKIQRLIRSQDIVWFGHNEFPNKSLAELQVLVLSYDWWNERDGQWSVLEAEELHLMAERAAERGDAAKLKWLLDDWQVSLVPQDGQSIIPIADGTAAGERGLLFRARKFEADSDSVDSEFCFPPSSASSRHHFYQCVMARGWDGKIDSLFSEELGLKGLFDLESQGRLHGTALSNLAYEQLVERKVDDRLEVLKILFNRLEQDGAYCLPRLDIVAAADELSVLQWMSFAGLVDLGQSFREHRKPIISVVEQGTELVEEVNTPGEEAKHEATANEATMDDCAICLAEKVQPYRLRCQHSFCQVCIEGTLGGQYQPQMRCPLCRQPSAVAPALATTLRLRADLSRSFPWLIPLQEGVNANIAQVLLGLAAGTGSLKVLSWLVDAQEANPRATCYPSGKNIFHLAAMRGQSLVCWWLCQNGFFDLATQPDQAGITAIDAVINSSCGRSVALILDMIEECFSAALPAGWLELAELSENKEICKVAERVRASQQSNRLLSLVSTQADLASLIEAVQTSDLADKWVRKHPPSQYMESDGGAARLLVMQLLDSAMKLKRFDFLRWVLVTKKQYWLTGNNTDGEQGLMRYCNEANQIKPSCTETQEFLTEVQRIYDLEAEIHENYDCFRKKVLAVASVAELEKIHSRHIELMAAFPDELKKDTIGLTSSMATLDNWVANGLNTLQWAFCEGHLQMLEWALGVRYHEEKPARRQGAGQPGRRGRQQQRGSSNKPKNVFEDVNVFLGGPEAVRCVLKWMRSQNMPVGGPFELGGSKYMNLLHAFAEKHANAMVTGSSPTQKVWGVLEYLAHEPAIKRSTLLAEHDHTEVNAAAGRRRRRRRRRARNQQHGSVLMHYVKAIREYCLRRPLMSTRSDLAEEFLRAVQLLEHAGANVRCSVSGDDDDDGKARLESDLNFPKFLVGQGQCFTLPTIRWLALERGVNIQFMVVGSLNPDFRKYQHKANEAQFFEEEFDRIRIEQARVLTDAENQMIEFQARFEKMLCEQARAFP